MKEIPLKGGRSTEGVVRVGDTLRRPYKQESEFANSALSYLQEQGYPYSQRYLGLDERGRDTFAFIDGYVPGEIGNTTLAQLCTFMKIVKELHDVSSGFAPEGKVICHNDLSPCNTVFRKDIPRSNHRLGQRGIRRTLGRSDIYSLAMDQYRQSSKK